MEYHSFIDSEGKYIGKTKYIKGEYIPIPSEEIIEDIRFINHKWRCVLPKVKQEKAYIGFNVNIRNCLKIDDTLLQLEVFCKKNKIIPELRISYRQYNEKKIEQQKNIIQSIVEHDFNDVIFTDEASSRIKCRSFFTYNYNTKKREYTKVYFRKNVDYAFDCSKNIAIGGNIDYDKLNNYLNFVQNKHNDYEIDVTFMMSEVGCNGNCWYCSQHQNGYKKIDFDLIGRLKQCVDKVKQLSIKENRKVNFIFIGGELTTLENDLQNQMVDIIKSCINENIHCVIFSNGKLKDTPIMKINEAHYVIHEYDWVGKKLETLPQNMQYVIIVSDKETIEDVKTFKSLNKDKEIIFRLENETKASDDEKKRLIKIFGMEYDKARDLRHRAFLCRNKKLRNYTIDIKKDENILYYCCACKFKFNFDSIDSLEMKMPSCPKSCTNGFL